MCYRIRVPSRYQSARCPRPLGSPGALRLHTAADVPMPPGVLLPLTVGATEAHTLPATPMRPLRASYHTSLPSVGTLHTRRRLLQTSASSQSLASVLHPRERKIPSLQDRSRSTRGLSLLLLLGYHACPCQDSFG